MHAERAMGTTLSGNLGKQMEASQLALTTDKKASGWSGRPYLFTSGFSPGDFTPEVFA